MEAPLTALTPPVPPVPHRVAIARFVVRSLCDDKGQPDTVLVVMYPWLIFSGFFFWEALNAPAALIDANVSSMAVTAVQLITLALILWAAALKLGEGVFVPLASAVGQAFRSVAGAARGLLAQSREYDGGPDRTVGLLESGGELARPLTEEKPDDEADAPDPPPMGDDPAGDRGR